MDTEKVSENIYELPQTGDMNVPARVYASEDILEEMKEDSTLEQVKNMASLPGIQKYSIVMPDGHQGYGFPIGGVAAVDAETGVISPGGIGFDINCLSGDSEVLLEFGRRRRIKELKDNFVTEKAVVAAERTVQSNIVLFTENESQKVFEIETETGEKVTSTSDHPFLTDKGMEELSELEEGSHIYVRPFEGFPDEKPPEEVILDEKDFENEDQQLINVLKDRGLLPLRANDREFNILLKLVGFHTGDGSFNNHGETTFYADKTDLNDIQDDIRDLGFKPSNIYSRERVHQVRQEPFKVTETSVKSTSKAFQRLLVKLGAPEGRKTEQEFRVPSYLNRLADWQKALYLSAFFGAEMSKPSALSKKNLYCPKISQNKSKKYRDSGKQFISDIKTTLEQLNIETNKIEEFETHKNQNGEVIRFRLGVKNNTQNLIEFFSKIGYRYNLDKQKKAVKAVQYLKKKGKAIEERERISEKSIELYENGVAPKKIKEEFDINGRFIDRSIYSGRKTSARPPKNFPDFEEYAEERTVNDNLAIKTTVKSIKSKGKETVYDIGVKHEAHNFQANQFIVSNCGVRLLKTDLTVEDISGKEEQIANILSSKVPHGLGKGGYIQTSKEDIEEILEKGMKWMYENGYATEEDIERCEENGRLPGNLEKVPEDAVKRGLNQVGSLGSGNHFLEVQKVSDIYTEEKAESYGLEEDQIVVMIHSGSRGLGHETCTKYLRKFEKQYPEIAEEIPEKNLMYAPLNDKLAQDYKEAMYAAANYAWANRQALTQAVRDCLDRIFDQPEVDLLYDVCHNIAKEERHMVDGEEKQLLVHRKGATRAFPSGREEIPETYRKIGQPVLIPGSMGTSSYILSGGKKSLDMSFGSTAHGAGRLKSRTQAKKDYWGEDVQKELERKGILVKAASGSTVAEEAPGVYKDIDEVIKVSDRLGIGEKVAKTLPLVNIKG